MTHRHLFLAKNELFAPLTLEKKNPVRMRLDL